MLYKNQYTFLLSQIGPFSKNRYQTKADLMHELMKLLRKFGSDRLFQLLKLHNEEVIDNIGQFDLITFPVSHFVSFQNNELSFDPTPILFKFIQKLRDIFKRKSYQLHEEFEFTITNV